jgi:hypothetical protein
LAILCFCDICFAQIISPVPVRSLHFQTFVSTVTKSHDRLYAVMDGQGVQVFDLTNPADPRPVQTRLPVARALDVVGSNVFLIDLNDNLQIYNAAEPANPQLLASLPIGSQAPAAAIVVVGDLAFVNRDNLIQVIDVSVPSQPTIRTTIGGTPTLPGIIVRSGDLIYTFANGAKGGLLKIINAQTPELLSELQTEAAAGIAVVGPAVYIDQSIYDCADPRHPTLKNQLPLEESFIRTDIRAAFVPGATNRVFLGYSYSVVEYDVSDPYAPKRLSLIRNTKGSDLLADGDFLYMPYGPYLIVFQISGQPATIPSLHIAEYGDARRVAWLKGFENFKLLNAPAPSGPWTLNTQVVSSNLFTFDYEVAVSTNESRIFYKLER